MTYAGLRARDCEQLNIASNDVDIDIRNAVDRHVELICDGVQVDKLPIVQNRNNDSPLSCPAAMT